MRWKIKGFEFCEHQQTLTKEHSAVRLEPMTSELLAYFCRHQNLVVSKAQLLEEVWRGRFVSDNTVSKLVTKLRKALKDDARNPAFIVTVPKRGYRFVAGASQITAANTGDTQQTPNLPKQSKEVLIRPLNESDLKKVQQFTDRWIGQNYYSFEELQDAFVKGQQGSLNASFIALSGDEVVGIRLTYAPGTWIENSTKIFKAGLSLKDWKIASEKMGYFKSLFVHGEYQGQGLGKTLSNKALAILKDMDNTRFVG